MSKNKLTLKEARQNESLDDFIRGYEPLEVPKEAVQRYIDASASPLDNRKANPSKSDADRFGDCK